MNYSETSGSPELQAIASIVREYFEGMYLRDLNRLRTVFHPNAYLFGHLSGTFVHISLDQWLVQVHSRPIPEQSGEPFDMRIIAADITGQAASVKVADLYRGLRFTDYLSLLKIEGEWLIVNKTFYHEAGL